MGPARVGGAIRWKWHGTGHHLTTGGGAAVTAPSLNGTRERGGFQACA